MCVTTGVDCSKGETLFNPINDKFVKDTYLGKMLLVLISVKMLLVLIIQVPIWEFAILLNHAYYRKIMIVSLQVVIAT